MAMNDRNNVKGTLGELSVAKLFVEQGCAVNFLTFMDVGMDLHVQMPADLKVPDALEESWQMSGRAAHVHLNSTATPRLPEIQVSTAIAWTLGARTGNPTLLVGVIVGRKDGAPQFRLFDPLMVEYFAECAAAGGKPKFKLSVSKGELVEPDQLFEKVAYWITNGPYMLSHAIPRPWPRDPEEIWGAAEDMIGNLTLMFERRFREYNAIWEDQTFVGTADYLADAFLEGAGLDSGLLGRRVLGSGTTYREATHLSVKGLKQFGGPVSVGVATLGLPVGPVFVHHVDDRLILRSRGVDGIDY
ncbi:hypothetical protein [Arthrobacter humicola]